MAEQIAFINVGALWKRAPLIVVAALALASAWYGVRWLMGDTMAEYAPASYATDPSEALSTAESAARLAPHDPLPHLTLARLHRVNFDPEELPVALREYEQAAALAPNDWLVWLEMGSARGSSGDVEGGIRSLRRAVELAPNYAQPRWYLGNLLLRAGRTDEAFAELRRAADADSTLRPQVFNLAWQLFNQDMAQVIRTVGNTPEARAQLATVLVGRGRMDDALALWSALSAGEKKGNEAAGETLARALYDAGRYHAALQVSQEMGAVDPAETADGRVTNGGFEADIGAVGKKFFDWQIAPSSQAQIAVDPRAPHGGRRSLRVAFNAPRQLDFKSILQLVAVEPATRYQLSFYVRAEDLRSVSTPVLLIFGAGDLNNALAASAPLAPGTSDWQQVSIEFTTPPHGEAILMRVDRGPCPDGACPIYGKVWYDDFDLQRTNGRTPAR